MSDIHPKRALPEEPRRSRTPLLLGAGALATAAVVGIGWAAMRGGDQPTAAANAASSSASQCDRSISVVADPAWAQQVRQAGKAWGESLGQKDCEAVNVTEQATATTLAKGLGEAQAWIPEDPVALALAKDPTLAKATPTAVGSSPLVLVNTPEAQAALAKPLQGDVLRTLLTNEATWKNHGHPEWGWFKLVVPTVADTTAGPLGMGSLMHVAGQGAQPAKSLNTATPQQVALTKPEQRIVEQVPLAQVTSKLATNPADANGLTPAGPRTGVTTLALALNSKTPVKATWLQPANALTMSVVQPAANDDVNAFTTWLKGDEGAAALTKAGVGTDAKQPDAAALAGLGLTGSAPATKPAQQAQVEQVRAVHGQLAKRDSVLLVIDTSASMSRPISEGGPRRIDVLAKYIIDSFDMFPPGMSNGLITFNASEDAEMRPQVTSVIPLQPDTTKEWAAAQPKYLETLSNIPTEGGTPLYEAIATAWQHNMENYQEGRTNRIIVVTDGADQDSRSTMTYEKLMTVLPKQPDPNKPIKVTYAAIGPDADLESLQKIAKATGQSADRLNSAEELETKFAQVMQS